MSFNHFMPTRVLFGKGKIEELHLQEMPGRKVLLIISNGKSVKENGTLDIVIHELNLSKVDYVIYNGIQANPTTKNVMDGAKIAKENNCDFIIALGGGSVMDASKAIAALATNKGEVWDYIHGGSGKCKTLKNKALPLIAITTTAGTGSEVDAWGVISNEETKEKIGFGGYDFLFPILSIVDPELMITVPSLFTAYQGFDALLQCVECYVSKTANLMSDMLAITGIEAIGTYLARAVRNGNDLEAREKVAFGNTISGMAMVVGCTTSEHSLEHAMSAFHPDLPHGAGLLMISKAYFSHLIDKKVCDDRFIKMAQALGANDATKPQDFILMLSKLQKECDVFELKMSDYGIKENEFENMAICAKNTMGGLFKSDRIELTIEDCVEIFKKSFK